MKKVRLKQVVQKVVQKAAKTRYFSLFEGVCAGAAAGLVTVFFRWALGREDSWLHAGLDFAASRPWMIPLWFAGLLAAAGLVALLLRWEPLISGSGIPQVEGELQGKLASVWWRVLLAKLAGGMTAIGCGLALGREGPSIQLGAMAGKGVSRLSGRTGEERLLITCGASAGLAAAFNAPLAGVLFSLEEVHKKISAGLLLPCMAASITADFISRSLFGLGPVFHLPEISMLPLKHYWLVAVLGVLLGLLGAAYNRCTALAQDLYGKIPSRYLRIALPFLLAGALGFVYPQVLGGGHSIVEGLSLQPAAGTLALLLAARFFFSIACFGSGAPGGIFLPLLVLGAVSGGLTGTLAGLAGISVPAENFVILGMAGFFAAVVRAPITGILLIYEMTGNVSHLLSFALVSLVAYGTAELLHARPIYDQLLDRILKNRAAEEQKSLRKA